MSKITEKTMREEDDKVKRQVEEEAGLDASITINSNMDTWREEIAKEADDDTAVINPHRQPVVTTDFFVDANKRVQLFFTNIEFSADESKNIQLATSAEASTKYNGLNEDRGSAHRIKLEGIDPKQIPELLHKTIMAVGEQCDKNEEKRTGLKRKKLDPAKLLSCNPAGSTSVTCVIHRNQIVVSNIGDSRALLMRRKKAETEFKCQRLTVTHFPHDEDETKRIKKDGGKFAYVKEETRLGVRQSRINGRYLTSRNYGAVDGGKGMTYEPSITTPTTIGEDEEAYVVMFSDGITDSLRDKDVLKIFNEDYDDKAYDKGITVIANDIRRVAAWRGSVDNKMIVIAPVTQHSLSTDEALLITVEDGNGKRANNEVSTFVAKEFAPTMQAVVDENVKKAKAIAEKKVGKKADLKIEEKKSSKMEQEEPDAAAKPEKFPTPKNLHKRNLKFINDLNKRINKLKTADGRLDNFLESESGAILRKNKIAVLEFIRDCIKVVNPEPGWLPVVLKDICEFKVNEDDLKNKVNSINDVFEVEKKFAHKLELKLVDNDKKNDTIYKVLSERRILSFFKASKPLSQHLIDKYLKLSNEEINEQLESRISSFTFGN